MNLTSEYEVSVTNTFEAETPQDAVAQMIEWLQEHSAFIGYRVLTEAGDTVFIDGDDL